MSRLQERLGKPVIMIKTYYGPCNKPQTQVYRHGPSE